MDLMRAYQRNSIVVEKVESIFDKPHDEPMWKNPNP